MDACSEWCVAMGWMTSIWCLGAAAADNDVSASVTHSRCPPRDELLCTWLGFAAPSAEPQRDTLRHNIAAAAAAACLSCCNSFYCRQCVVVWCEHAFDGSIARLLGIYWFRHLRLSIPLKPDVLFIRYKRLIHLGGNLSKLYPSEEQHEIFSKLCFLGTPN